MPLFCTKGSFVEAAKNGDLESVHSHLHSRFFRQSWLTHCYDAWTALMWAACKDHTDVVKQLIHAGANVNRLSGDGFGSTLTIASGTTGMTLNTIIALVEAGADLNIPNSEGYTPLHRAVLRDRKDIAEYLLQQGANTGIANKEGKTALDLAVKGSPIAHLLETHLGLPLSQAEQKKEEQTQQTSESWIKIGTDKIAHVGLYPEIQQKITEVFNFTARERIVICEKMQSDVQSSSPPESFDTISENILRTAFNAFTAQQGVADEDFVFRGVRLLENRHLTRK